MAVQANGTMIRVPQGDTGVIKFQAEGAEVQDGDQGVFTLANRSGAILMRKILPQIEGENAFNMPFTFEETAALKPGEYAWSLAIVQHGTFDGNGKLTAAEGKHTVVTRGMLIVEEVAGGAR